MNTKLIVALSGVAGAGKDTVGNILITKHGFTRVSFADVLKEEVSAAFGLPLNFFHDRNTKDAPLLEWPILRSSITETALGEAVLSQFSHYSPRLLCIYYASVMRGFNPDVWISKATKYVEKSPGNVVITDLRFLNEADWVRKRFGKVVRVNRPDVTNVLMHESETQLNGFNFDLTIVNDSGLSELDVKVSEMLRLIKEGKV
jgi:hypothetical protein